MLSWLSPASRPVLVNRTNLHANDDLQHSIATLSSSPFYRKRSSACLDDRETKRVKLSSRDEGEYISSDESGSDMYTEDVAVARDRARKRTVFSMRNAAMMAQSGFWRYPTLPTRFPSAETNSFTTLPYACAYSYEAKQGGIPLLAVATEEGSVHIMNTSKRQDWDCEPPREVFRPHENGIFDVQWAPSDTLLATASGDQSVRISSLGSSVLPANRTLHVLRSHESTIKCVAWDPSRDGDVLCTGGRDGSICLWDLRVGEERGRRTGSRNGGAVETGAIAPVIVVQGAHGAGGKPVKPRGKKGKLGSVSPLRSITSLVYPEGHPHCVISSGSYDGILQQWDFRLPTGKKSAKAAKALPKPVRVSSCDPTTLQGTRRPRGITTLVTGHGPSAGLLLALGTDSRVHTYSLPSLDPLSGYVNGAGEDPWALSHANMQTNSFYVRLALSPCGRWLANGNAADGRVFLFDISSSASSMHTRMGGYSGGHAGAVELCGQTGEVGALDWAHDMLATCADDATVRVWRPDVETYRRCADDSEEMRWEWSWATH